MWRVELVVELARIWLANQRMATTVTNPLLSFSMSSFRAQGSRGAHSLYSTRIY
jgi:hypothetical protein